MDKIAVTAAAVSNILEITPADGLLDNSKYTIRDLVQESGFSDGYVRKIITTLKNQHMIERVGSNKTGYWKIHTNSQID